MKRVIIVHGYTGYPDKNWFPWLKTELEKENVSVTVPQMPHTTRPQLNEWLPHLQQTIGKPDTNTFLVGHSLGCITILRYLETLTEKEQIGGVILVAGFAEPLEVLPELNNFFQTNINQNTIRSMSKHIVIINSDTDEYVPLWQGEKMAQLLKAKFIVLPNAGHINQNAGYTSLPIVLSELRILLAK